MKTRPVITLPDNPIVTRSMLHLVHVMISEAHEFAKARSTRYEQVMLDLSGCVPEEHRTPELAERIEYHRNQAAAWLEADEAMENVLLVVWSSLQKAQVKAREDEGNTVPG